MAETRKTQPQPSARRPQRADARRNRQGLLAAAMDAFAEQGVDVNMADIARRAGIATGTVYRHFPTKQALVDALLIDRLALVDAAVRDARSGGHDPWEALERFIREVTALQLGHRALSQFIGGRIPGSPELRKHLDAVFDTFASLVDAAKRNGQLRPDVEANDIRVIVICIARAGAADWPPPDWILDRYLGVVLDGLRHPTPTPLTGSPPGPEPGDHPETSPTASFRRGRRRKEQ